MIGGLTNSTDDRMILKDEICMRVAVGSMRLTKNVDFDQADGVPRHLCKAVSKMRQYSAHPARLRGAEIDPGRST